MRFLFCKRELNWNLTFQFSLLLFCFLLVSRQLFPYTLLLRLRQLLVRLFSFFDGRFAFLFGRCCFVFFYTSNPSVIVFAFVARCWMPGRSRLHSIAKKRSLRMNMMTGATTTRPKILPVNGQAHVISHEPSDMLAEEMKNGK